MYEFRSPNIVGDDFVTVRLYEKSVPRFAGGGLVQAAEAIRGSGRGGDEVLVHVNPEEYKQMQEAWGEPSYNPHTGLPEYGFFSKIKKVFKKIVKSPIFQTLAPIVLNLLVPGLGVAVGGALGASGAAAGVLGRAVIGAGVGALGGGGRGALAGAVGGAAAGGGGKALGSALGASGAGASVLGNSIAGGAASKIRGGSFTKGALTGGALSAAAPYLNNALVDTKLGNALDLTTQDTLTSGTGSGGALAQAAGTPSGSAPTSMNVESPASAVAGVPSDTSGLEIQPPTIDEEALLASIPQPQAPEIKSPVAEGLKSAVQLKNIPKTLAAVGALGQLAGVGAPQQQMMPGQQQPLTPQGPLTALDPQSFNRTQNTQGIDYYNYGTGTGGEYDFFDDDEFGDPEDDDRAFAEGGEVDEEPMMDEEGLEDGTEDPRYAKGPGTGRSDEIDAKLSDGEYVFDAETVALLGDGSSDAGAQVLDDLRRKIRAWKGKKLAKGEISDDAPDPAELLGIDEEDYEEESEDELEQDVEEFGEGGKVGKLRSAAKRILDNRRARGELEGEVYEVEQFVPTRKGEKSRLYYTRAKDVVEAADTFDAEQPFNTKKGIPNYDREVVPPKLWNPDGKTTSDNKRLKSWEEKIPRGKVRERKGFSTGGDV